jgi:histidyl-tRNA synthetase
MARRGGTVSKQIQRVTGMQDVLPDDRRYWDAITAAAESLARRFGFQRIDLPIIESEELFVRGVGQGWTSSSRRRCTPAEPDGSRITLRPETPPASRALHSERHEQLTPPVKLTPLAPAHASSPGGRLRQHSQFNAEILGEDDPAADVEV